MSNVLHHFHSGKADGTDATQVQPSNWNADHDIQTPAAVLGDIGIATLSDTAGVSTLGGVVSGGVLRYLRQKGNVTTKSYEFVGLPFYVSSDFNFAAISPGGALTSGITNTVTLPKVPMGVNGSNTNHYVYITGGTGTAEKVLITGGTAVSEGLAQTITFVPANNHSGAWTIISATSGIQEAIKYIGLAKGLLFVPPGDWPTYATIKFEATQQIAMIGAGIIATSINPQFGSGDCIYSDCSTYALANFKDFAILPGVARTSGYDFHVLGATFGTISDLLTRNTLNGYEFENCNSIQVTRLEVQSFTGNGFFLNSAAAPTSGGFFSQLTAVGLGVNAMLIQAAAGCAYAGTALSDCNFQLATNLINMFPNGGALNEFNFDNIILDTWGTRGLFMQGGSGTGNGCSFSGIRMGSSSEAGYGVGIYSNWSNIVFQRVTGGGGGQGFLLSGCKNVTIDGVQISGNGTGNATNVALTIQVDPTGSVVCDNIKVSNSSFGLNEAGTTGGVTSTVGVSVTNAAHTNLRFVNVIGYGNGTAGTAGLSFLGTGAGSIFLNCDFNGAARPTAGVAVRGSTWYVKAAGGVLDTYAVCRKDAADAYAWVTLF